MKSTLHPSRSKCCRLTILAVGLAALTWSATHAVPHLTIVAPGQTWSSSIGLSSHYLAAQAVPGSTKPVVMAGRFDLEVSFPSPTQLVLIGAAGVESVFAGILAHDGTDWIVSGPTQVDKLEPRSFVAGSSPTSELRDLAVVSRSSYFLTGIIDDATFFRTRDNTDFFLTPDSTGLPQRGFVATGGNGTFNSAHYLDLPMQPHALATDPAGATLVVVGQERDNGAADFEGNDAVIQRYSLPLPPSGTALPAPDSISGGVLQSTLLKDAVVTTNEVWIGGTKSTGLGGSIDVWLARADFATNKIVKPFFVGSETLDDLIKMERGPDGEIYVAFTVQGRQVSFGSRTTFDLDAASAALSSTHAFVGKLDANGSTEWLTPLGLSQNAGSVLEPVDLSVDEAGNACVTVQGTGSWLIEGVSRSLTAPGQISLTKTGRVVDFTPTPALGNAGAGAIPDLENRFVLGESGGQSSFTTLESTGVSQAPYVVRWKKPDQGAGLDLESLSSLVTAAGGQVHLEANFPLYDHVAVAAYLTPRQLFQVEQNLQLVIEPDQPTVEPDAAGCAVVENPDWALARLFNPFTVDVTAPSVGYHYPSAFVTATSEDYRKVRVYLIDKNLNPADLPPFHPLGDAGGLDITFQNPEELIVTGFANDDPVAVSAGASPDHPLELINLIAGAGAGSAQGTAMDIYLVDPYSSASSVAGNCETFTSYVACAILDAASHAAGLNCTEEGFLPSLIVIASSGEDTTGESGIGGAIERSAIFQGIPVILSAGNAGGPVDNYVPARFGDIAGVITVGGLELGDDYANDPPTLMDLNRIDPDSNTDLSGDIISLYAPSVGIETGYGASPRTGTSYSCALVAGLAVNYLSRNPCASPAEVEDALEAFSVHDEERDIFLARSFCSFAQYLFHNGLDSLLDDPGGGFDLDSDGDGDHNLDEFLGGSDPNDPLSRAHIPVRFTRETGEKGNAMAVLSAWLPADLVREDGTLHTCCWSLPVTLELGQDLHHWMEVDISELGSLGAGDLDDSGRRELRFETTLTDLIDLHPGQRCFLRFGFGPPSSP